MSRNRTSKDAFSQVTTSPSPGGSTAGGCIPDSVASAGARFRVRLGGVDRQELAGPPLAGRARVPARDSYGRDGSGRA